MKKILLTLLILIWFYNIWYADSKVWSNPDNYRTNLVDKINCYSWWINNSLYIWTKTKYSWNSSSSSSVDNFLYVYVVDWNWNLIKQIWNSAWTNVKSWNGAYTILENNSHVFYSFYENTSYDSNHQNYFSIWFNINKNTCQVTQYYNDNSYTNYAKIGLYKDYIIFWINNEKTSYKWYIKQTNPNDFLTWWLDLSNADVATSNPFLYLRYINDNFRIYGDKIYILWNYNNYFRHYNPNWFNESKKTITDTYYDANWIKSDIPFSAYTWSLEYYKIQLLQNYSNNKYNYLSNINNLYLPMNLDFVNNNKKIYSISGTLNSDGDYEINHIWNPFWPLKPLKILIWFDENNIFTYNNSWSLNYSNNLIYNWIWIQDINNTHYLSYAKHDGVYIQTLQNNQDIEILDNPTWSGSTWSGSTWSGSTWSGSTWNEWSFFSWLWNPFKWLYDKLTNIWDTTNTIWKTKDIWSWYIQIWNSLNQIWTEVENHDLDIKYNTGNISQNWQNLINWLTLDQTRVQGSFLYITYLIMKIFAILIIILIIVVIILSLI